MEKSSQIVWCKREFLNIETSPKIDAPSHIQLWCNPDVMTPTAAAEHISRRYIQHSMGVKSGK
jgi:hypothetical protein